MSERGPRFGWVPPFLVGGAAAVAAEVAIGILLYADTGLMRSLSTVLVTEAGAFAVGLWSTTAGGRDLTDRIRRRWLMALVAFLAAAVFGTSWTVVRDLGTGAIGQGIGLAVLAALPLYACGSILGGLGAEARAAPRGWGGAVGSSAAFGFAVGFGLAGFALPRVPMPSSLLIGCLVALSFGGLVYGAVAGSRPKTVLRASREGPTGEVRIEERSNGRGPTEVVLLEGGRRRRSMQIDVPAPDPWDVALVRALVPPDEEGWRVLAVGAGASGLPRAVCSGHPTATVEVLERSPGVVELGRDHFSTALELGEGNRRSVRYGNLDDLIDSLSGAFDLVVVDEDAVGPLDGGAGISRRSWERLVSAVGPVGLVVFGPAAAPPVEPLVGWASVVLTRDDGSGGTESVRISARAAVPDFEDGFAGFSPAPGDAVGP